MEIGTPQGPGGTRVMLLGAGEVGKEVIIALQRLGVEVVAVDRYAGAPGHQVAHRAHVIDMAAPAAIRALVEKERPHLIVPEIEAIATEALLDIERDGVAEVIPTARAVQLTMNREGIRRLAVDELELLTSRYAFTNDHTAKKQTNNTTKNKPKEKKPEKTSSGKGQSVVNAPEDVAAAWDYAMSAGRVAKTRVIVEQMIEFDYEITLLTV